MCFQTINIFLIPGMRLVFEVFLFMLFHFLRLHNSYSVRITEVAEPCE